MKNRANVAALPQGEWAERTPSVAEQANVHRQRIVECAEEFATLAVALLRESRTIADAISYDNRNANDLTRLQMIAAAFEDALLHLTDAERWRPRTSCSSLQQAGLFFACYFAGIRG